VTEDQETIKVLSQSIAEQRVMLFAGAGLSANLGLPTWGKLVEHILKDLKLSEEEITHGPDPYLTIPEYYRLTRGSLGALRSWMDIHFHSPTIDIGESAIHKAIIDLNFPIIYTTNYDRWLERAYEHYSKEYVKISNVGDLLQIRRDATQIIKFHGDFDDDASLVLTESSYFERLSFESPLDIKLRADALEKPILFVGYSLGDINTRYLLYKLQKLWESSVYGKSRPRSYILLEARSVGRVYETVLRSRGVVPITFNSSEDILRFLKELAP
jgi:hypothetical protein